MDQEHYYNLFNYLLSQQVPEHFSQQQTQQLVKQVRNYKIQHDQLYKIDQKDFTKVYRVITKPELPALLYSRVSKVTGQFVF